MVENTTPNRGYPLPDGTNNLASDVGRLIAALLNIDQDVLAILSAVSSAASVNSPVFTGEPKAPTAAQGTNSTQIANTTFVQAAIEALVAAAPGALDTLNELAAALDDDPNFATTVTNALAAKLDKSGGVLTGNTTLKTTGSAVFGIDATDAAAQLQLRRNGVTKWVLYGNNTDNPTLVLQNTVGSEAVFTVDPADNIVRFNDRPKVAGQDVWDDGFVTAAKITGKLGYTPWHSGTLPAPADKQSTSDQAFAGKIKTPEVTLNGGGRVYEASGDIVVSNGSLASYLRFRANGELAYYVDGAAVAVFRADGDLYSAGAGGNLGTLLAAKVGQAQCNHNTGTVELAQMLHGQTVDVPNPYVVTGLRYGPAGEIFQRVKALRNY